MFNFIISVYNFLIKGFSLFLTDFHSIICTYFKHDLFILSFTFIFSVIHLDLLAKGKKIKEQVTPFNLARNNNV